MQKIESLSSQVTRFFNRVGRRRLLIQTHDIPDPDALASADAMRFIARHFGVSARIVVNGFPHRRENNALIKECKIHLKPLDSLKIRRPDNYAWLFVDCLPGSGNVTLHKDAPGGLFLAIDHHGKPGKHLRDNPGAFILYDRTVGATATLLGKLLLNLDVTFPPRLASAITYAIITDTQDFSRGATDEDLEIYSALFHRTNHRIISRLRNVSKPRDYFRTIHASLESAYFYRHAAWAFIGEVDGGETVAEIADFILSCERITWALALGYTSEKLFLSVRSSQPKSRCERVTKKIVREFRGTAGGHDEFAGGFVFLDGGADPEKIAAGIIDGFIRQVLRIPKSAESPAGSQLIAD